MLAIHTIVSVITTITMRSAMFLPALRSNSRRHQVMVRSLDYLQVLNVIWSLSTNITATLIITHKTWYVFSAVARVQHDDNVRHHRVLICDGLKQARSRGTRAEQILGIVIETGILYCICGVRLCMKARTITQH